MFSKSFITLVALAALAIAAPIANIEGSAGDYQYLSRRGTPSRPGSPTPHSNTSPPPSPHAAHASGSHSPTHAHASGSHHSPHRSNSADSFHSAQSSHPAPHRSNSVDSFHSAHSGSHPPTPHRSSSVDSFHSANSGSHHSPSPAPHPHHHLIGEVQAAGHKISAADVVHIWRLPRPIPGVKGQHAWLEKGSETAGMQHIMHKHGAEFAAKGITEHQIPHLAEKATTSGEIVGTQGSTRTIYKTEHNGQTQHVAVETGNNGFVVGMNPSSEKSVKKAAKAWQARLAKHAANPPDQHPGNGPGPGPGPSGGAGAGAIATRR